jgi:hypothetical protein
MTKHLPLTLLFTLVSYSLLAQAVTAEYIFGGKLNRVDNYVTEKTGGAIHKISFDFGDDVIVNPSVMKMINDNSIMRIDFVYTKYRESSDFNQRQLNVRRVEALQKAAPFLFNNTSIEWNVYEIREAENRDKNEKFFHGFVVYMKPHYTMKDGEWIVSKKPMTSTEEVATIKSEIKKFACYDTIMKPIIKKRKSAQTWTGKYLPNNDLRAAMGDRYDNKGIWGRQKEMMRSATYDTIMVETIQFSESKNCDCEKTTAPTFAFTNMYGMNDTVITTVLERNKKWKDIMIVEDVTGSMMPYTIQTLAWRKLNNNATMAQQFLFFNDGDKHPDGPIGRSGGTYFIDSRSDKEIEKKCYHAMNKGGGGGAPENNIEALIEAQKQNTSAKEIVMIADNWANVRDLSLLDEISVPVHVILCGAANGNVNADYLAIAYATGGSIHTIEQDLEFLSKLKEGEKITVGDKKYKLRNGRFELAR